MKNILVCFGLLAFCQSGFSGVYLYNNTSFPLKAKVIAANGITMGEKSIEPQATAYAEDQLGEADPIADPSNSSFHNYKNSLTPYQVIWYCSGDGESVYGTCTTVSSGATVMATTCAGPQVCNPPKEAEQAKGSDDSTAVSQQEKANNAPNEEEPLPGSDSPNLNE